MAGKNVCIQSFQNFDKISEILGKYLSRFACLNKGEKFI